MQRLHHKTCAGPNSGSLPCSAGLPRASKGILRAVCVPLEFRGAGSFGPALPPRHTLRGCYNIRFPASRRNGVKR